jgi:hypothetical protein
MLQGRRAYKDACQKSFAAGAAEPQGPAAASNSSSVQAAASSQAGPQKKLVLYRGIGMVPFRVLVRLKVFQLAGVAALAIPINTFLVEVISRKCTSPKRQTGCDHSCCLCT